MLLDSELSGYDLYKEMTRKGVRIHSNYLYMVLTSMHRRRLLKDRWVEGAGRPRRHLYSLSREGKGGVHDIGSRIGEPTHGRIRTCQLGCARLARPFQLCQRDVRTPRDAVAGRRRQFKSGDNLSSFADCRFLEAALSLVKAHQTLIHTHVEFVIGRLWRPTFSHVLGEFTETLELQDRVETPLDPNR